MGKDELKDAELISMLRLRGIKPSQIFKAEEIFEDENFHKKIQTEVDYKLWLRDQEADEELNKEMEEKILKEKENENEFIPGDSPQKDKEKKKEDKKKPDPDDSMIPDVDDKGEPGNSDDMIPD